MGSRRLLPSPTAPPWWRWDGDHPDPGIRRARCRSFVSGFAPPGPRAVAWSRSRGVPFIPGVLTPTEIHTALAAGAPAVKLFPASVGGPALVKALLGPHPDLRVIPTGGVDESNAGAYLDAGAVAVGVGDWLTAGPDLDAITRRARTLASIAR